MFWRRKRTLSDFDAEIHAHLQAEVDQRRDHGASEEDARTGALRAFGNVTAARERFYEAGRWLWLDHLLLDLRYAFRTLAKHRGFSLAVIATIGLAIAANSAIFTVVHAVLLRPLPYTEPERLVGIIQQHASFGPDFATLPDYQDWRDNSTTFESLAGAWSRVYNLTGMDEPERLAGAAVTGNFFATFRVAPAAGRTFTAASTDPREVVLSYGLWQRRFGGDEAVVGRRVALNGQPYIVVGVAPSGFAWPPSAELWVPFVAEPAMNRGYHLLQVVGRLKPGATLDGARAELSTLASQAERAYPAMNKDWGVEAGSLLDYTVSSTRRSLWLLAGAVACVLLIACANVAGLLTARALTRRHEMSLRAALGASRGRIVRQLLTESLVLAVAGGAVGLGLASLAIAPILSLTTLPRSGEVSVDLPVFVFTLFASLATGVIFGLIPAIASSRADLRSALTVRGSGFTGRLRPALLVIEIAVAVVLLTGAGLLLRSFHKLLQVDTGFSGDRLLTTRFFLPRASYPVERCVELYQQMIERVKALPGVETAAAASVFPFSQVSANVVFEIQGRPPAEPGNHLTADFISATPGYFRAMGIGLLSGRDFDEADRANGAFVAVVNRAMADRFFPGQNPIGQFIRILGPRPRMIVGVVANIRQRTLLARPAPEIYAPHSQFPTGGMFLIVRSRADEPARLIAAVRGELRALDRDLPIASMKTADQLLGDTLSSRRFSLVLLSIFAGTALFLSSVGVYAVLSFTVSQRTKEIGIRLALGAAGRDVLRLMVRQGMLPVLLGALVGLGVALGSMRVLATMLFEIRPSDPVTLLGVTLVLLCAALVAVLIPARKAARVDPVIALQ